METAIDWWARAIGALGVGLAGLGLLLQYRQHRLDLPKLSLKIVVRDPDSDIRPWELVLTLTNRGGSHVGISTFQTVSTHPEVSIVDRPTTPLPQGAGVGAHDHFTWKMELWPVHPNRVTAEYVTTVHPVVGRPVKATFQTGTHAGIDPGPQWVEDKFREKGALR